MDKNGIRPSPPESTKSRNEEHRELVLSLPLSVQVVLGSTSVTVAQLMSLGRGAVISLDQRVGDPVEIVVSGRVVARGEVVVTDEDGSHYGVTLTQLIDIPANMTATK